jgi:hypothetical protein
MVELLGGLGLSGFCVKNAGAILVPLIQVARLGKPRLSKTWVRPKPLFRFENDRTKVSVKKPGTNCPAGPYS